MGRHGGGRGVDEKGRRRERRREEGESKDKGGRGEEEGRKEEKGQIKDYIKRKIKDRKR